ncbi:MAG TPA: ABC transporter permease [Acidobacteriota bacterium]|nr:ABC transporter permease [Acidobacteriota bacterium]
MKREWGILALLIVLCALVTLLNPRFLGAANLQNMARLTGMYGIFSIGVGVVIITGGIDLSVGSIFALLGIVLAISLTEWGLPWPFAVLLVLSGAVALGLFHGALVTRLRIQPFIATLCGLLLYRGMARFIANDESKGFGAEGFETLRFLATGTVFGIPMPLILLLAIAAVAWVVLERSVYGRYLYAVGHNREAARYSGIRTNRVVAGAYVVSSFLAGVSAILLAFYTNSISPSTHGSFYELYGIAAAVLGGCSLRGGEGSVAGILVGAALLQVLQNLVNLLGIPSSLNFAVMGGVILIGVALDSILKRRRELRAREIELAG